ncbi:MAG: hypothetical protein WCT39_00020 [Candidatus Margulisiibacteriota bacterium]
MFGLPTGRQARVYPLPLCPIVISLPGAFKGKTTRISWDFGVTGKLWQERFFDHVVRKQEDLKTIFAATDKPLPYIPLPLFITQL